MKDALQKYLNTKNIIIAVGGDGTINRILNNIIGSPNYLGVIPVGTGNDFYKSITKQNKELYEKVDVVKINDRYFINIACFGIDADVGNNTKIIKNKLIPINQRYNASLIYTFFKYKNKEAEFSSKEESKKGKFTTIVIANGMYYGGGFNIAPNSKYNDGLLDIYYAQNLKKYKLPSLVLKIKKGKHENSEHINKFQTKEISIKLKEETICNIDGDEIKGIEFHIKLIPKAITLYNNQELVKKILK